MNDTVNFIGEYQLQNLIRNQVRFLYLDLRSSHERDAAKPHSLLAGSRAVLAGEALKTAKLESLTPEHPIVLICGNAETSVTVARELEKNGFRNVYVVRGGLEGLGGV